MFCACTCPVRIFRLDSCHHSFQELLRKENQEGLDERDQQSDERRADQCELDRSRAVPVGKERTPAGVFGYGQDVVAVMATSLLRQTRVGRDLQE